MAENVLEFRRFFYCSENDKKIILVKGYLWSSLKDPVVNILIIDILSVIFIKILPRRKARIL